MPIRGMPSSLGAAKAAARGTAAKKGKFTAKKLLTGSVGAAALGGYMNKTGRSTDKVRGRPTGPYMY